MESHIALNRHTDCNIVLLRFARCKTVNFRLPADSGNIRERDRAVMFVLLCVHVYPGAALIV